MSTTIYTDSLKLPLYTAASYPTYLGDWNHAMENIDRSYKDIKENEQTNAEQIGGVVRNVSAIEASVLQNTTDISNLKTDVNNINNSVNNLSDRVDKIVEDGITEEVTRQLEVINSNINTLQNDLAALNTRVDNAISGGDIQPPFTFNFINTPYNNSTSGTTGIINDMPTLITIDGKNNNSLTRRYSKKFTPNTGYILKLNISTSVTGDVNGAINIYVNNNIVKSIPAGTSFNGSVDISNFRGIESTLAICLAKNTSTQQQYRVSATLHTVIVTNED